MYFMGVVFWGWGDVEGFGVGGIGIGDAGGRWG
jgi:hypothetical protein